MVLAICRREFDSEVNAIVMEVGRSAVCLHNCACITHTFIQHERKGIERKRALLTTT